jgi:hypothetical protein
MPLYSIFKYVSLPSLSEVVFKEIQGQLICSSKNNHFRYLLKSAEQTYVVRVESSCDGKTFPEEYSHSAGIVGKKVWILNVDEMEIVNFETSLELVKKDILSFLFFGLFCGAVFYCVIILKVKLTNKTL